MPLASRPLLLNMTFMLVNQEPETPVREGVLTLIVSKSTRSELPPSTQT